MKQKIYLVLILFSTLLFAQQKKVETSIDVKKNKIGAQFNLTLKTNVDTISKVVFPNLKNFGKLEVIRSYKVDTISKGDRYELIKKYGLTQFDSGKYTIPSLVVKINNMPFQSDSISVEVSNVVVDTLKQKMFDIKPIAEVASDFSTFWKYVFILLFVLVIGALIYFLLKKYQKKKIAEEAIKTPIEKATTLLQTLEKKELWQKGEVKAYYSELTDIARNYIEEALEIPAMESTTSELIQGLRAASIRKKMTLSQEILDNLERVLQQADLVKFAKSKPLDYEIAEDKNKIEKAIVVLDRSIPVEIAEDDTAKWEEMKRLQKLKKQKRTRILTAIGFVVGAILGVFLFFIMTKGFDYVKDNIIGRPTKELLEGQWILSDYGTPSITVETPSVLVRTDISKQFPKETLATLKELKFFVYGSFQSNFYIALSTMKTKQETEVDLKISLEATINGMGGQNVVFNTSEFQTKEGSSGLKGFGTMIKLDPILKKSTKLYFDVLVFNEDGGLQQIMVFHEEGDKYAEQIAERVFQSIEFKKATE
jgi:hypothetical protein